MSDLDTLYLTTRELATLLRIKERKVYELVANGEVPCSRATGKLLFPREAIDAWLARKGSGFVAATPAPRPSVILGSHDPLLDWAVHASTCGLATHYEGSGRGLASFARGEGVLAGLHLPDADGEEWNIGALEESGSHGGVLVEFAWRERGLLLAAGNPRDVKSLADLGALRLARRQAGAGAEVLLEALLRRAGIDPANLDATLIAHTETEAASAVADGSVDAAFGLRAVARQHGLDFVSVTRERFDLLVDRKAWFDPPCQTLLAFLDSDDFARRAATEIGYELSGRGTVRHNG